MSAHDDLTVIAVAYNSAADLPEFVSTLRSAADGLRLRTIVVDNASSDDTVRVARELGVECLEVGANVGYAGGVNRGRALVDQGCAVMIANPDVRFTESSVRVLLDAALATRGVCVPRITDAQGVTRTSLRREPSLRRGLGEALLGDRLPHRSAAWSLIVREEDEYASPQTVDWATGAVMVLHPDCDRAVGPWPEEYFLYSEEVEACWRARAEGFDVTFVPSSVVFHAEGGSGRSAELVALDAVNRVRYFRKRNSRLRSRAFAWIVLTEKVLRSGNPAERLAARWVARLAVRPIETETIPEGKQLLGVTEGA